MCGLMLSEDLEDKDMISPVKVPEVGDKELEEWLYQQLCCMGSINYYFCDSPFDSVSPLGGKISSVDDFKEMVRNNQFFTIQPTLEVNLQPDKSLSEENKNKTLQYFNKWKEKHHSSTTTIESSFELIDIFEGKFGVLIHNMIPVDTIIEDIKNDNNLYFHMNIVGGYEPLNKIIKNNFKSRIEGEDTE